MINLTLAKAHTLEFHNFLARGLSPARKVHLLAPGPHPTGSSWPIAMSQSQSTSISVMQPRSAAMPIQLIIIDMTRNKLLLIPSEL
jgi:hypothetical protein